MDAKKPHFRFLNHTADLGIIVRGVSLKHVFEEAARSMMWIMIKTNQGTQPRLQTISVTGEDREDLMVRWLGEILYLFHGEKEVVTDVEISSISQSRLKATLKTVSFHPNIHKIHCEMKAVTYHQIQVEPKGKHWEARIIFDL